MAYWGVRSYGPCGGEHNNRTFMDLLGVSRIIGLLEGWIWTLVRSGLLFAFMFQDLL